MKKIILLGFTLMFCISTAQAQFFKKLKKKVEEKVEHAVTENISNKAASEANKSLNKMWETDLKNLPVPQGANRVDISKVPQSYDFNWEYKLNMETKDGTIDMTYLLNKDHPYFGIRVPKADGMHMVLDNENKLNVMFFASGDNNFISATEIKDLEDYETEENPYEGSKLKKIDSKMIMGYSCQGYETENEEHKLKFYVTRDAPISFANMYNTKKNNIPDGWNVDWFDGEDALMMEMEMIDKSKPEDKMTMRCIGLEKKSFSLNKDDYASLGAKK